MFCFLQWAFVDLDSLSLLSLFVGDKIMKYTLMQCELVVIPIYLNCNRWLKDFEKLYNDVGDLDIQTS